MKNIINLIFSPLKKIFSLFHSWGYSAIFALFALIFLYYFVGGRMMEDIYKPTQIEITAPNGQSATINTMADLIDREVNQNFWTPNLPIIFPAYFLDNMPNYQLGQFESLSSFSSVFSKIQPKPQLEEASKLLQYSGRIWMFSPSNKLLPVSSANSQYRKARKKLIQYTEGLEKGHESFYKKSEDLSALLKSINKDLNLANKELETNIRERSSLVLDLKSDDVFYHNQGKMYANYLFIKSLGYDYKDIILENNLYPLWTKMIKSLEDGIEIDPCIASNGELSSIWTANHLAYLELNVQKTQNSLQKIITKLDSIRKKP